MRSDKSLNITFLVGFLVIFLVALGLLPRATIIPLTVLFSLFVLSSSLEKSVLLFAGFIPFFVAIPITDIFDSFNMWRIIGGLIFLKWFFTARPDFKFRSMLPFALVALLFIAVVSIGVAHDKFIAIKRIIYFINLSLVPIVVADLIRKNKKLLKPLLQSLIVPGFILIGVGFIQLISSYFIDAGSFHLFWSERIQLGFYGSEWSKIALNANTWFAYYGEQLSLRMFSTFPDSHSFPIYLLFTIPILYALKFNKKIIAIFLLAIILSGTRGVWLAFLGPIFISPFLLLVLGFLFFLLN